MKFRNLVAHGTSEKISDQETQIIRNSEQVKYPETWWEKHSNRQVTKRWLADTKSIITIIHKAAGKGNIPFAMLSMGDSHGTFVK
jgi:hypothetical protein